MTVSERMTVAMGAGIDEEVSEEESAQRAAEVAFVNFNQPGDDGTTVPMDEMQIEVTTTVVEGILQTLVANQDGDMSAFEEIANVFPVTFGAEPTQLDPALHEALSALTDVGQYTDVIRTETGIFVGQLTSLFDEDATNAEIERILTERRGQRVDELIEEWRTAATIVVNEDVWAQVSFLDLGVEIYEPEAAEDDLLEELDWENLVPEDEGEVDDESQVDEDEVDDANGADEGEADSEE
jgi:hypothetical protein